MSTGSGSTVGAKRLGATGSDALVRLRRGELTLDAYLDFRADEAVKDLASALPKRRVALIRETIREQLATDPVLLAMVEHVTTVGRAGGAAR